MSKVFQNYDEFRADVERAKGVVAGPAPKGQTDFLVAINHADREVLVFSGGEAVFTGQVQRVAIYRSAAGVEVQVTNEAGDQKIFSGPRVESVMAKDRTLRLIQREEERLARSEAKPKPAGDQEPPLAESDLAKAARDIEAFFAAGDE